MKRFITKVLIGFLAFLLLLVAVYGVLLAGNPADPAGKFGCYHLTGHHRADVLRFREGQVRLKTCCGDEDYGTYSKESSGDWVWIWQKEFRPSDRTKWRRSDPVRVTLKPGIWSMDFALEKDPGRRLSMPRRVFTKWAH